MGKKEYFNPDAYVALTALQRIYFTAVTRKPCQDDTVRVTPYKDVPFAVFVELLAKDVDVFAAAKAIGAQVEGNIVVMPPATVEDLGGGVFAIIPHIDDSLLPVSEP